MNPDIELSPIVQEVIDSLPLLDSDKATLSDYGFLGWIAPHLYFGEFEKDEVFPVLKNWSWKADWNVDPKLDISEFDTWLVFGSGPDNEPIIIKPYSSTIWILSNSLELEVLNSNMKNLIETSSAFADMISDSIKLDSNSSAKRIPVKLVDNFIAKFNRIEGASVPTSIWLTWANERTYS